MPRQRNGSQDPPAGAFCYEQNTWICDPKTDKLICDASGETYQTGFHLFLTEKDARTYARHWEIVRKVKFRNVVAQGDHYLTYVVAREIFIENEEQNLHRK